MIRGCGLRLDALARRERDDVEGDLSSARLTCDGRGRRYEQRMRACRQQRRVDRDHPTAEIVLAAIVARRHRALRLAGDVEHALVVRQNRDARETGSTAGCAEVPKYRVIVSRWRIVDVRGNGIDARAAVLGVPVARRANAAWAALTQRLADTRRQQRQRVLNSTQWIAIQRYATEGELVVDLLLSDVRPVERLGNPDDRIIRERQRQWREQIHADRAIPDALTRCMQVDVEGLRTRVERRKRATRNDGREARLGVAGADNFGHVRTGQANRAGGELGAALVLGACPDLDPVDARPAVGGEVSRPTRHEQARARVDVLPGARRLDTTDDRAGAGAVRASEPRASQGRCLLCIARRDRRQRQTCGGGAEPRELLKSVSVSDHNGPPPRFEPVPPRIERAAHKPRQVEVDVPLTNFRPHRDGLAPTSAADRGRCPPHAKLWPPWSR